MQHYEIEDIRNRATIPDVDLTISQFKNNSEKNSDKFKSEFNFQIKNTSNSIVNHYNITIYCPRIWQIILNDINLIGDADILLGAGIHSSKCFSRNYTISNSMPLWKNKSFNLLETNVHIEIPLDNAVDLLIVDLSYPYAPTKRFLFGFAFNSDRPTENFSLRKMVEILND